MTAEEARRVHSSSELSVGDEIEAWHNGKLFHRGRVNQTVASMDLFWILDSRTGTRRLIDVEALVILRAAAPAESSLHGAATHGAATPGPGRPGPGRRRPARGPGRIRRRTFRCSRPPASRCSRAGVGADPCRAGGVPRRWKRDRA